MGTKDDEINELKKAEYLVGVATHALEIKTNDPKELSYYQHWSPRYQHVLDATRHYLGQVVKSSDQENPANNLDTKMLDAFHANLDRLRYAVARDKGDVAEGVVTRLDNVKKAFNQNKLLKDPLQTTQASQVLGVEELADVAGHLVNRFDYLYTRTDTESLQGGSGYEALPMRGPGQGKEIGALLDTMRNAVESVRNPLNPEKLIDDMSIIKQQLKNFNDAKNTLKKKLNDKKAYLTPLADNAREKPLAIETNIILNDIDVFEKKFQKQLDKQIAAAPATGDKKVGMNLEGVKKEVALLSTLGMTEATEAFTSAASNLPKLTTAGAKKKPNAQPSGTTV